MTRRSPGVFDIFSLMLVVVAPLVGADTAAAQEQFKGTMERIGAVQGASRRTSFSIRIQSYTSIEEEQELLRLLREQGAQALHQRLLGLDRARFQMTGASSVNIAVVFSARTDDGGRFLRLLTAREFDISWVGGRSFDTGPPEDQRFGLIELHLDADGKGTGAVFTRGRVALDGDNLRFTPSVPPYQIVSLEPRH